MSTLAAVGPMLRAAPAAAQACCAGAALVNPARLALHEDFSLGLQTRARADLGSFGSDGRYQSAATEQDFEQDLAGSVRISERAQAGAVLPLIETRRIESGIPAWGSGIGDVALNARYDFLYATEALYWPGIGLMANLLVPTGKPVGQGTSPSSTDATGTGTYNLSLGLDLEKVNGPLYVSLNAWLTYCGSRTVTVPGAGALTTSFPLQWTVLAVAGWVFPSEAAVAVYANVLQRGDDTLNGALQPETTLRLVTAGLTGILPVRDRWRLQGTLFGDLPISSLGQNELAGVGLSFALVRVWL